MTSDVIQPIHDGVDIIIKLLRSLVIKAAEIIVQARDGSNVTTKCFPISTDFFTFNLNIREIVEVERDVKRLMNPISDRWSVCIEIDLKTPGGVHMVLETWNVYLMANSCEDIPSITVHNRLGLLLKSLLTITRVVPGYRYARKQTPDSHKLSYKIYTGEPQYNLLGDECKHYKVGSVVTPLGTVHLAVHYRTKMSISPQTSQIGATMMVKSNHFENNCISNSDPKPDPNKNSEPNDDLFNHTEFEKRIIPFGEDSNKQLSVDDIISDIPFKFLLPKPPSSSPPINETKPAAVEESSKDDSNANVVTSAAVTKSTSSNTDDFIMVDVVKTPPFAELTDNMELSNFYQEFLTAPPLLGFGEDSKVRDLVGDLTSQLESYESTSIEFDKLVNSLCEQDDEQQEAEDAESPSNSRSPHFFF